ncbi:MAG: alpha/beta hydrolase [Verrucomicrobiales bacterium]|nr:alpha/beta hydrolase [Verrucomicrobiales bacterium]
MKLTLTFSLLTLVLICRNGFAAPVTEALDITYANYGDRAVKLDLYLPANESTELRPAVVLIHGGGWIGGSRKNFRPTAMRLAAAGYVVANISYRLATEAKFPGCVSDAKTAVRWMRAHASEHRIDTNRIYAIGGSAGGHLAAMVATSPGKFEGEGGWSNQSSEVAGVIMMGTGVDQVTRVKESKSGSVKNCVIFFGGELSEKPEVYADGSPITHISKKTPPTLFLDGEFDNPGKRYVEMRKQLDELGVQHELVVIPGAKHGQWGKEPWKAPFEDAMLKFLSKLQSE